MNFRGYRDTLIFQRRGAQDDVGEPAGWTDVVTQRGSVMPLRGRELIAAQQAHPDVTVRVQTRYNANIVAQMRAQSGGSIYSVLYVIDINNLHRELELLCSVGVNRG